MILVTGAAGYIGSVLSEILIDGGYRVVALDNLSKGHLAAVPDEAVFIEADAGNYHDISKIFKTYEIDAVVHLAADTEVEASFKDPVRFFKNNVACGINLVECMLENNVRRFIFSSSAAVYGEPAHVPVSERTPVLPINPYGESKLMFEKFLYWCSRSAGLNSVCLRYFNVAGASVLRGEDHQPPSTLIAVLINVAAGKQGYLPIYGDDYPTADGTCIRDFIHVLDISEAHVRSLEYLNSNQGHFIFNLGNGSGYSVKEALESARKITGKPIAAKILPRRPGDPANVIADAHKAQSALNWKPGHPDLDSIIGSAWSWQSRHLSGYSDKR
jgi:UDP-glucose 4-epimerase